MKDGLYPKTLEVINFKGIKHNVIDFGNGDVLLIGGNGVGKSSLIDALRTPFNAKYIPQKPIHADEERGIITLTLAGRRNGVEENWEITHVFTPSNRTGKISLTRNGQKVKGSEKTLMKEIFGQIGFSLDEFFSASVAEQVKMLKKLTGCEDTLDQIDEERKVKAEQRMIAKSKLDDMKAVNDRQARPFTDEDIEATKSGPLDERALEAELGEVGKKQEKWNTNFNKVEQIKRDIGVNEMAMKKNAQDRSDLEIEIKKMQERLSEMERENTYMGEKDAALSLRLQQGGQWLQNNPRPSTDEAVKKLSQAKAHNQMCALIEQYAQRQKEILALQKTHETLDKEVKGLDKKKIEVIASSQLPVDGLLFTEDSITLNGVPIEQVNTQKKLDLAISITTAMNPTLKLVIVGEASLFDEPHLEMTLKKLEDQGYFWIAEAVNPEGGELDIQYHERSSE